MAGLIENILEEKYGADNTVYDLFKRGEKEWNSLKSFVKAKTILVRFFLNKKFEKIPLDPENGEIKVKLKKRWDSFPDPEGKRKSFFAGRSEDINKLKNWIAYSDGGSVLVRGFRGIGKTAFVYQSLSVASDLLKKDRKKLRFVPINFSGIAIKIDKDKSFLETKILKTIIKSLYQECPNLKGIDSLFKFSISETANQGETEVNGKTYSVSLKTENIFFIVLVVISLVIIPLLIKPLPLFPLSWQNSLFFRIVLHLSSFVYLGWAFLNQYKKEEKITTEIQLNSPGYLSSRLNEILKKDEKYVSVFVIDELDKLFKTDEHLEQNGVKEINKIIRKLKYLFTLSRARFIFIVHEEYPYWKERSFLNRPEESTYFNWEIFLAGISLNGIRDYFGQIMLRKLGDKGKRLLEEFIHYISYDSKRVFSEINQILRDYIKYDERGYPYLVIKELDDKKMREAVIENIMDNVLTQEEEFENTLSQREFYHKTYLILRKTAEDIEKNKLLGTNDSLITIIRKYSMEKLVDQINPDYVCSLTSLQEQQMISKIKEYFISMQKNAFSEDQIEENKLFFDEKNSNEAPINASLSFENIDIGGLPKTLDKSLSPESFEFKKIVDEFKMILKSLKRGLKIEDDVVAAISIFRDEGVSFLAATSLAAKIDTENPKTHHLQEIRKLKEEGPEFYRDFERNPIEWLKNWLSYSLVGSIIENVSIGNKTIGFKILIGELVVFVINQSYGKSLSPKIMKELNKALIILINDSKIKIKKKTINLKLNMKNLNGAQKILEEINKKVKRSYRNNHPKLIKGKQESHFAEFLDIKGKSSKSLINKVEYKMKSISLYWRVGFLFGQNRNDDYEPLGDTGFPLIHIHKDIGDSNLKLTTYSNGKHPPDTLAKDLGISADSSITVRIEVIPGKIIRLFVNDKPVYNTIVDIKFLNKVSILTWGDRKIEYKGVYILNYSYEETI